LLLLEIGLPRLGFTPLSVLLGVLAGLGQFAILLLLFEIGLPLLGFTPLSFLLGLSSLGRRLVLEGKIDQPQRKEREDSNAHNQQRDNRHRYFSRHSFHSDVWGHAECQPSVSSTYAPRSRSISKSSVYGYESCPTNTLNPLVRCAGLRGSSYEARLAAFSAAVTPCSITSPNIERRKGQKAVSAPTGAPGKTNSCA
jgi:hypothetical protein